MNNEKSKEVSEEAAKWFLATVGNRLSRKEWGVVSLEAIIEDGEVKKITTTDRSSFIGVRQ